MVFQNQYYEEIAYLGEGKQKQTILVRNGFGNFFVFKEIAWELFPVYEKVKKAGHKNMVSIYGIEKWKDGYGVLMEYFPSCTLEEWMMQAHKLSVREAAPVILQICSALNCLKGLGIVHRDLSPSNILINQQGIVKITDFGIARFYKKGRRKDTTILGTAGYAAPEQFGFFQTGEKTDIYALGVLMNQMLCGKLPQEEVYEGNVKIGSIIRRCLSMNMEERCEIEEIEEAVAGRAVHKSPAWKRVIKKIPGFRTGNKVHMTLAAIEYSYMTMLFLMDIFVLCTGPADFIKRLAGFLIATLGVGWFAGSFRSVSYRLKLQEGAEKAALVWGYFLVGFGILLAGSNLMM